MVDYEDPMNWFHGKKILVPFDFSDASLEAVKVGLSLANSADDVHVLHVLIELPATEPAVIWNEFNDTERIETAGKSLREKLKSAGVESANIDVKIGTPSTKIADEAQEIEARLIIIPSHGYTGIKRMLLGSVAERVVRLAHCPVLVLKQP